MNIHEFQAKELFRKYNIPVLKSQLVHQVSESKNIAQNIGGSSWVLKAQVHAGGRGKAGGIKIAQSLEEVSSICAQMLAMKLVTEQTGQEGEQVHRVLIEQTADIEQEFYLAFLVDRSQNSIRLIISSEGGVDIEQTAKQNPEKVVKINISLVTGLCSYQKRMCAYLFNLDAGLFKLFSRLLDALYFLFIKEDLSLLEINPLVLTSDKKIIPLDAKVSLDSNAQFRHENWKDFLLLEEKTNTSVQAQLKGFSFVRLTGNIGCMVNGAGLAMATMDMIQLFGGEPANFLDVGGSADAERIQTAFQFIIEDPKVQGILVNIFGGIVRCDLIAEGVIASAQKLKMNIPLVVRLEGNSSDSAQTLLDESSLNIVSALTLQSAVEKIISLTNSR